MTAKKAEAQIEVARDCLSEASRWMTTDWRMAEENVRAAMTIIRRFVPGPTGERLILNLTVAVGSADVEVFRGYAAGVRYELSVLRGRVRAIIC